MEKKKVTVFVAGQKLNLITSESQKYVSDIASKVDTAIMSMFTSSNMSREKCAVMVALDLCDDEAKLRQAMNEVKEQVKDYIVDISSLKAENAELKAEIEKLKNEKKELLNSKKTLIASAVEIKDSKKVETKTEEKEINADDDLSFDFEEEKVEEPKKEAPKTEKKRHNHNHTNPYKERFMKEQKEEKGYTPVRQYSLFDDKED